MQTGNIDVSPRRWRNELAIVHVLTGSVRTKTLFTLDWRRLIAKAEHVLEHASLDTNNTFKNALSQTQ